MQKAQMHRCRRQRALVWAWLMATAWCACGAAADAQLLFDQREEEQAIRSRPIRRATHSADQQPGRLSVTAESPEEILEAAEHTNAPKHVFIDDEYEGGQFESGAYENCDACGDGSCGGCRPFHAGPFGWLHEHFDRMKVQQQSTSWLNRPMSFGVFAGNMWADKLIKNRVSQSDGFVGGYYLGEDLTINWGWELRLTLSELDVHYDNVPLATSTDEIILADLNFHYYPWENARWRPYATFGFGLGQFDFADEFGQRIRKTTFGLPIGIGMKYLVHRTSAFRLELVDNIAFASGRIDTQHNISLVAGLEIRFGGVRRSYWPWNPGQDYGYW
jgi:opacity protein-like surface antigen